MESCYVPNNPNFASVDQWTPPSPTSPPVTSSAEVKQHHHQQQHQQQQQQQQQQEQQQQQQQHFTHHNQHHHDPVIQQLCDSADLVHSGNAISSSVGNDPSSTGQLTSLSALPPVQELLGPCRSPNGDGSGGNKDRGGDPFSGYSLTALDFEPLPGFLTLSSCASYKQHQEMGDLPLSFKSGQSSHSIGNYGSLYSNHHSPQPHPHQHQQQGPMSPFSAAVAAATQQQQSQNSAMNGNSGNGQCQYSFHGPTSTPSQTAKMPHHHHSHHHHPHHQSAPANSTPTYQDSNYGGSGCGSAGIFPSMSVNVSMNMTMGMGMSMGPTMSYGIETGAPLQCWNTHNVTSGIHHLPGVAAAAAAAAAVTVNSNNTGYPIAPPAQALLSPIQVSYNSNIYPTSFTPSSASGYCLPGDWRPTAADPPGLYELKELKESSPSPFSNSGGSSKNFAKSKSSPVVQQQHQNNYSTYPAVEAYPIQPGSNSPVASKKRSIQVRQPSVTCNPPSVPSLTPTVDYDGEMASCGSGVSSSSSSGSSVGLGGAGQGKANLCRVCGKTYARPSTLKTHMRTHSGERPYRCGDCHKSFSQAANLTAHVRTHSGEKPFRCQICDRRFSQSSSVTTHMRTHSGERPYRCRMCKKAFSDSSTLTKHMRIHSGEKPYQCKLCLLRFSQSGNLNRHMRVHSATS